MRAEEDIFLMHLPNKKYICRLAFYMKLIINNIIKINEENRT